MNLRKTIKHIFFEVNNYAVLCTIISCIISLTSVFLPYVSSDFINRLSTSSSINELYHLIKIFLGISLINIIFTYINYMIRVKFNNLVAFELNYRILDYVKKLPLNYFDNVNTTYLTKKINEDSFAVTQFIISNFLTILINIINFAIIFYLLFKKDFKIVLLFFIIIPFYIIMYYFFKKKLYISSFNYKEKQNLFFSKLDEQIKEIKIIKIHSCYNEIGEKLRNSFNDFMKYVVRYNKISAMYLNLDSILSIIMNCIILIYGGINVVEGNLLIGDLILINTYFVRLLSIMSSTINIASDYQTFKVSYDRLDEIANLDIENNGTIIIDSISKIIIKDLKMTYNDKIIINNLNYTFKKGNIYCLRGNNGSGKTTFINIIIGLIQEYKGEIFFDSNNIRQLDLYKLRKNNIGVVEQEPCLFNDSLKFNLLFDTTKKIKNSYINEWFTKLDANRIFDSLNNSNNIISERASNISGGEKQKIAIIRALIKNPDVIILDEPTSAFDLESVEALKECLVSIKKDKIIIVITHDNWICDISDEELILNN